MSETERERLRRTQEFFAARAATWDTKFGDDGPAYAAAVREAAIHPGAVVADIGCGTGRALHALRVAAGVAGRVIGLDVTAEMLDAAQDHASRSSAQLLQADALLLPLADRSVDVLFAAGLINHLPDPAAGLHELARVTRDGGHLILFHPTGRAALAARHGRELRLDEPLNRAVLGPLLAATGWKLSRYDDAAHRFFALAERGSAQGR